MAAAAPGPDASAARRLLGSKQIGIVVVLEVVLGKSPREPALGGSIEFLQTIWAVDHALNGLSRLMESRLGLTGPQRLVVRMIGRMPGISGGALAGLLHLDPSTLTGHVRRLVKAGLVRREESKEDRRRIALSLTADGRRLDVAMPGTVEAAVAEIMKTIADEDLDVTRQTLGKLVHALEKQFSAVEGGPGKATRIKRAGRSQRARRSR